MKRAFLSLVAAACSALTAAAVDATAANVWLDANAKPVFQIMGKGIQADKGASAPTFTCPWQYVSIPLHVEGKLKGDEAEHPHFISELKLRISLAIAIEDDKGKVMKKPVILQKDVTYVDVPLAKSDKKTGKSVVNVGVFVSPASAYKLNRKNGDLSKKLVGVAVEGTFNGANCNRLKGDGSESPVVGVVVNQSAGKELGEKWWRGTGSGSTGAVLNAISETPFAPQYAEHGFPPVRPMYGAAESGSSSSSSTPSTLTPVEDSDTDTTTTTDTADTTTTADDSATTTEEDSSSTGSSKRGNKRGSKRSRH